MHRILGELENSLYFLPKNQRISKIGAFLITTFFCGQTKKMDVRGYLLEGVLDEVPCQLLVVVVMEPGHWGQFRM